MLEWHVFLGLPFLLLFSFRGSWCCLLRSCWSSTFRNGFLCPPIHLHNIPFVSGSVGVFRQEITVLLILIVKFRVRWIGLATIVFCLVILLDRLEVRYSKGPLLPNVFLILVSNFGLTLSYQPSLVFKLLPLKLMLSLLIVCLKLLQTCVVIGC